MVKPVGDHQCIFDYFLTKPVGSMQNWGKGLRGTRGGGAVNTPKPPTNRALWVVLM